jgi:hypothetical protein
LRGADQISEGGFRSGPQLAAEQQRDEPAPPPGREVEVSIEADERASIFCFHQRDVFVVFDAERQVNQEVNPASLRIYVHDVDGDRPPPAE